METSNELTTLRVSLARVAQAIGVDNKLGVTGKAYLDLLELAKTNDRGWNELAALCAERAAEVTDGPPSDLPTFGDPDAEAYRFREFYIPERMMGGIQRYVEAGVLPGDFLTAVLQNDLRAACERADDENMRNLPAYMAYFYNNIPAGSWGSPENVSRYSERKRAEWIKAHPAVEGASE